MKQISGLKYAIVTALAIGSLTLFSGCTRDKIEAKNMDQIHKEEGVPVRTVKVTPTEFKTELSFHSVLTGIKESTAFAAMGDKVEKILVNVGDYVKKDQVLVTFPTDSPSASYFQAKVSFENAQTAFKRIDSLYKSGGISLQERDNAKTQFDVSKANWNSVKQMIKVKAPISGYVTKVHVSESDNVKKEAALVTIAQTDKLKAAIWVSEDEISNIETGMTATATWKGNRIEGTVTQVDMAMNAMRKAFRAVVEFDNTDKRLIAGTTVNVNIITSQKADAIVVERKNIISEQHKHYVFVVKNGKSEKRDITMGNQQGLDVEVLQGLRPGEVLVIEGQMLLKNDSKVKVVNGSKQ
jgi:membrane fusion protein, multidrug efflux system